MTVSDFLDEEITPRIKAGGSYIPSSDQGSLIKVLSRTQKWLARVTYARYIHDQTVTLVQNEEHYDLNPVWGPEMLWIDGQALKNENSTYGPDSRTTLWRTFPNWRTTTGKPSRWARTSKDGIILLPRPDQVYSNCFTCGWAETDTIDTDDMDAALSTELFFGDSMLDILADVLAKRLSNVFLATNRELSAAARKDTMLWNAIEREARLNRSSDRGLLKMAERPKMINLTNH